MTLAEKINVLREKAHELDLACIVYAFDDNGGGFDYANAFALTDLAATSATGNAAVLSSASYNFVAGDVSAWEASIRYARTVPHGADLVASQTDALRSLLLHERLDQFVQRVAAIARGQA